MRLSPSRLMRFGLVLWMPALFSFPVECAAQEEKKSPPGGLDRPALEQMLKDFGYEIKYYSKGIPTVVLERGRGTYPTRALFSNDLTLIYLETSLVTLKKDEEITAAALLKLLSANDTNLPAYFSYLPNSRLLLASRPVPNRDLTPAALRKELDAHAEMLARTTPFWIRANLLPYVPPKTSELTETDLANLTGTWAAFERELGGAKSNPDLLKTLVQYVFKDGKVIRLNSDGKTIDERYVVYLDATSKTKTIDLVEARNGGVTRGIYKIEDDILWLCFDNLGPTRPGEFASGTKAVLIKYRKLP